MTRLEEPIVFPCHAEELVGMLHHPEHPAATGVIIVVGGPQYRVGSHRQFLFLARFLATQGIAVLRFDYRGMGDSSGDLRTFESINDDIHSAVEVFKRKVPEIKSIVLWGLCDAASASLFYVHKNPNINGLVLLNPWVRTESSEASAYLKNYYLARLLNINFWRKFFSGEVSIKDSMISFISLMRMARAGKSATVPRNVHETRSNVSLPDRVFEGVQSFPGHILIILSGKDLTADEFKNLVKDSRAWKKVLKRSSITTMHLKDANHTFSTRLWRHEVEFWTLDWLRTNFEMN